MLALATPCWVAAAAADEAPPSSGDALKLMSGDPERLFDAAGTPGTQVGVGARAPR
jgi:hypothetical protein